ncbi:MAG: hypothetical protein KAQ69_01835 [Spirochaetales bacterium]|nr:hypothetical protein [Spirochaetales bacterium]
MAQIKHIQYRKREAVALRTSRIEAIFFTEFGAKMVSLKNLLTGYEFLYQGTESRHPDAVYDSEYIENDLCGADDMFPTINATYYPDFPWKGVQCPDHGELWSIPWSLTEMDDCLSFETNGIRFPYTFKRVISCPAEKSIRFDYSIINRSPFDFFYIWAFHPLLNAGNDTEIQLPPEVHTIINTLDLNNSLGRVGSVHTWPVATDKWSNKTDLSQFTADKGNCDKFYVADTLKQGMVTLRHRNIDEELTLSFPTEEIPYLGIWKNQAGFLGQNNIAIEPASGSLDDLWVSKMWGSTSKLKPFGRNDFWLEITIA